MPQSARCLIAKSSPRSPTLLIVIAAHHSSENVAAQRFSSMLRSFRPEEYEIHVVCRATGAPYTAKPEWIDVHELPGACVGSGLGRWDSALTLLTAFVPAFARKLLSKKVWLRNVVDEIDILLESNPSRRPGFIISTYSPVDALIAAKCLGDKHGLPRLLDFRDGLAFESLGRAGRLAMVLRRWAEGALVKGAAAVTTVSGPLLEHFQRTYPRVRATLLTNGYDEAEHGAAASSADAQASAEALVSAGSDKFVLAHFGRVGASDYSATDALRFLVRSVRQSGLRNRLHLLFVGELTLAERDMLQGLGCSYTLSRTVDRLVAHAAMRRVDGLLLLTGSRVGCATGKIFDYMAAGPPIVCFTMVENEAARILARTGCGQTAVAPDHAAAARLLHDLVGGRIPIHRDASAIRKCSRREQAIVLQQIVQAEARQPREVARERC